MSVSEWGHLKASLFVDRQRTVVTFFNAKFHNLAVLVHADCNYIEHDPIRYKD